MTPPTSAVVRPARPDDLPSILALIRELASYERALHEVEATEERLGACLFGDSAVASCRIAEVDGRVAGFVLWFVSFSTWLGSPGMYLEDLYVRPELRGRGIGRALLRELARICVDRGYRRLDWAVLGWNVDARAFYAAIGAEERTDWIPCRLTDPELSALAGSEPER